MQQLRIMLERYRKQPALKKSIIQGQSEKHQGCTHTTWKSLILHSLLMLTIKISYYMMVVQGLEAPLRKHRKLKKIGSITQDQRQRKKQSWSLIRVNQIFIQKRMWKHKHCMKQLRLQKVQRKRMANLTKINQMQMRQWHPKSQTCRAWPTSGFNMLLLQLEHIWLGWIMIPTLQDSLEMHALLELSPEAFLVLTVSQIVKRNAMVNYLGI